MFRFLIFLVVLIIWRFFDSVFVRVKVIRAIEGFYIKTSSLGSLFNLEDTVSSVFRRTDCEVATEQFYGEAM